MKRPFNGSISPTHMSSNAKRPAISRMTKKLVIKNFQSKTFIQKFVYQPFCLAQNNDSSTVEKKWGILEDAVLKIQKRQRTEYGREELYKVIIK